MSEIEGTSANDRYLQEAKQDKIARQALRDHRVDWSFDHRSPREILLSMVARGSLPATALGDAVVLENVSKEANTDDTTPEILAPIDSTIE